MTDRQRHLLIASFLLKETQPSHSAESMPPLAGSVEHLMTDVSWINEGWLEPD